jgi:anti-sigma factor RsiW
MKPSYEEQHPHGSPSSDRGGRDSQLARFELLSAYIDGEVTASERQQVQHWLDTDPQVHRMYVQLLRLHQDIHHRPLPPSAVPSQQISERVFQSLDRHRQTRRLLVFGSLAIATALLTVVSNLVLRNHAPHPQFAHKPSAPTEVESETLMIALNRPILDIPPETTPPAKSASESPKK